jgi:2-dehydropantoate 2-reductase
MLKTAKNLSFNIIGAGAMGHLWASFLIKQGFQTHIYARKSKPNQSLKIISANQSFQQDFQYRTLSQWLEADIILICVKAHQLHALCLQLQPLNLADKHLVLMMNGMGLVEVVNSVLPQQKVLQASIVQGAYLSQNILKHTGSGTTLIGPIACSGTQSTRKISSENLESIDRLLITPLNKALAVVKWNPSQTETLRLKLIINAIINPLTSLANQSNGMVLENEQLSSEAEQLLNELKPLLPHLFNEFDYFTIKQQVEQVALQTSQNISSMLQDIRSGKPTEIDFINGYLVALGQRHAISLPKHQQMIKQIKQLTISQISSETR